jgi:hypothetical protein
VVQSILVHSVQSYGFSGQRRSEALRVVDQETNYHIGILLDLLTISPDCTL